MKAAKAKYDASKGMYVLQIRNVQGGWDDYFSIKSQADLDASIIRAKCCAGAGNRAGAFRVVHKFMGTTVIADLTAPGQEVNRYTATSPTYTGDM